MSDASTIEELTRELAVRGVSLKGAERASPAESDRPWFIGAVLGVSGWLAGLFALVFVALLAKPQDASDFGVIGVFMLGGAFALYTVGRNVFVDQLALAVSMAAQLALLFAAADGTQSAGAAGAIMAALELFLLALMPNRLAKTLAAFFAVVAGAFAVRFTFWDVDVFADHRPRVALLPALAGWLAIWVPLIVVTHWLVATEARWMAGAWRKIARPALIGLLAALSLATWVSEPFASLPFWREAGEEPRNFLALWPLLATGAALFAAISAYRLRDRPLVGVAVVGALLHASQFYYALGLSLLAKSVLLGVLGGSLLFGANLLARRDAAGAGSKP